MRDWPGHLVSTPSGGVFVRHNPPQREGTGGDALEPAVFVHGLGGESLDWADVAAMLADRLDGHALDLPGFGESPPPARGELSLDAHAAAVVDVIKAIDRGPVHLVGNSLGGSVVTRVAAEHPELVKTLTLVSPALPDLRPRLWSWQLLVTLLPFVGTRLVDLALRGDPDKMASRICWLCYGDPHAVTDRRRAEVVAAACRRAELSYSGTVYRSSLRSLVSAYVQVGRRRLWRQAKQVSAPTLLMYGGRDKLVDPRMAKRAAATFPNAHLVLMLDAGHVAHLEHPARVAATLRDFIDGRTEPLGRGMGRARGTVVTCDASGNRRAS